MLYILYKCIYMSVIIIIEYSRPVTVLCYITYIYIYIYIYIYMLNAYVSVKHLLPFVFCHLFILFLM